MARVTVEDCIVHVPNRFDLVLMAAQRAKQITSGNPLTVDRDNDKDAVVALREIADRTVSLDQLNEDTIHSFCKKHAGETTEKPAADAKANAAGEISGDVQQAFDDAGQHLTNAPKDAESAGLSFVEENIEVED